MRLKGHNNRISSIIFYVYKFSFRSMITANEHNYRRACPLMSWIGSEMFHFMFSLCKVTRSELVLIALVFERVFHIHVIK